MREVRAIPVRAIPPSIAPTVLRNGVFLLLAYLVPRTLTFGAVIVAARVLETTAFGAYSTAAAFAVMLSVVATLGMMPLLIREIARVPEKAPALLRSAHVFKTITNVGMLASVALLGSLLLDYPPPVMAAALLLSIGYAIGSYVENLAAYFQAVERMEVWMQASAITGVVWGGIGTVLIVSTESLVWFCLAPALGQLAGLAWLLYRAPAEVRGGTPAESGHLTSLSRSLLPFACAALALTIYYKIDILLLAFWRSDADVGIYSAAYKLLDIWQALMIVAVSAAYPRLARIARHSGDESRWAATRLAELVLLVAVPIASAIWLARVPIVFALYGTAYQDSIPVLGLLAMVFPALGINVLGAYVLATRGHISHAAGLYLAGGILKVGLNAVLVPTLGALGAAQAMLVSELLLAGGFLLCLRTHAAAPSATTLGIAGGALALWGGSILLTDSLPGLLAAGLYLAAVLLLYRRTRAISAAEWRAIRSTLGSSRDPAAPATPPHPA